MKITLEDFTKNYVFIITLFTIYILNNDHRLNSYQYTRFFNLGATIILLILLILKIIYNKDEKIFKKIDIIIFGFIFLSFILTYICRKYINFHGIYLLFAYIYMKEDIIVNKKLKKNLLIIVFFSVIYQLVTIRFLGVRPVINWYDPNYSSFYLFCLFLLLKKENMRYMASIILISGFFTLSRNYILAVICYLTIEKFSLIKRYIIKYKFNNFYLIMLLGVIGLLTVESIILTNSISQNTGNNISRLYKFKDASNKDRFTANIKFKKDMKENFKKYQFGTNVEEYTKEIFRNVPHNYIYGLILNYGLYFTLFFYMIFGKIYNRFFVEENIAIILSFFLYYLFLGVGIQGFPGLLTLFVLNENRSEK